jgi:ligand-binding sensor domain-containing protein
MRSETTCAIYLKEMQPRHLLLVLMLSIQFACAYGQSNLYSWKPDNDINFFTYPALPHNVQGFAQDKYGYLWIGSYDGLYRFDGITFRQYIYNGKDTNSTGIHFCRPFLVDFRGILWARTSSGLCMLNTSTRQFRNLNFSDTLFNDVITDVTADSKNNIWIRQHGEESCTCVQSSASNSILPMKTDQTGHSCGF